MPFLGVEQRPGSVVKQRVPIGQFADSSLVLMPVVTITGQQDGPTMVVLGGSHGDEVTGIEIARRVIDSVTPAELRGALVVVPVAAIPAYLTRGRGWVDEERLEMNGYSRVFPGHPQGLMSERIAHTILSEFIGHAEITIDLHSALDGCNIAPFTYVQPDRGNDGYELRKKIALIYGTPYVFRVDLGEASEIDRSTLPLGMPQMRHPGRMGGPAAKPSTSTTPSKGSAVITAEMGESRRVSWEYVELGVRGVRRSLHAMGMLPNEPEPPLVQPREFSHIANLHVNTGGGLHLTVNEGDEVTQGQSIGWIEDVFGDRTEELVAPATGFILRKMKLGNVATGAEAVWVGYTP